MIGVLPNQEIEKLIKIGAISSDVPIESEQIQPASLDMRLGSKAFRIRASFLPGSREKVEERLKSLQMHEIDLRGGAVLEKGCVYLVPLLEVLKLPTDIQAAANAKSSTGRLDLLTRTISDAGEEFDRISSGYSGKLYAEICPRSFSVLVRKGMKLNQIRFRNKNTTLNDESLKALHAKEKLVPGNAIIDDGLGFSVDLQPSYGDLVGYRAKPHTGIIDLDLIDHYDPADFWDEIRTSCGEIILDPGGESPVYVGDMAT
jgi:dCTP deaminase